nr:hypothetical protein CFP56_00569 [Quercus suber]
MWAEERLAHRPRDDWTRVLGKRGRGGARRRARRIGAERRVGRGWERTSQRALEGSRKRWCTLPAGASWEDCDCGGDEGQEQRSLAERRSWEDGRASRGMQKGQGGGGGGG